MISTGLKFESGRVWALDQTCLPHEERWLCLEHPEQMVHAIQRLAVRGAPLIGVAAALSLAQFAMTARSAAQVEVFAIQAQRLRAARPTAVNLARAVDRIIQVSREGVADDALNVARIVAEAEAIFDEDVALSSAMAERAAELIQDGDRLLTHCNTGGLACVGVGTALGAIRLAHESGKRIHVFVDETRPLLQGARLTAWELQQAGIPHTLICDNMAGFLMRLGRVDKVFVGADRIAANGDVANKIGTYSVAVLARHHGLPFYVVAPETTFDATCATGADIRIEERAPGEVCGDKSPRATSAWNPAFDVTPRELITAIILNDRRI